ncbi:MAG: hypothetical protein ABSF29_13810 [Tepidisphaeraceae bacterium]|jgi:hypothetical protein
MINGNAKNAAVFGFLISSLSTLLCYLAAGPTLGVFFGGFFVAAFLAPVGSFRWAHLHSVVGGIWLVWLIAVFRTSDTVGQWVRLGILLGSFSLAVAGMAALLRGFRVQAVIAAGTASLVGLAWLFWPIWLSPQFAKLSEGFIEALVRVHPPLVANGVLENEPPWTERFLAYRLTRLDQDTPMRLPTDVWPGVVLYLGVGAGFLVIGRGMGRILPMRPECG